MAGTAAGVGMVAGAGIVAGAGTAVEGGKLLCLVVGMGHLHMEVVG